MSSLNSIFRGIANRVNTNSLLEELIVLIEIYDINATTKNAIMEITNENLHWIATYSDDIQDFLDIFLRNSSPAMSTASCFIIVFGLAFNWIMQN
jgi:hypothetical protein